MTQIYHIYAQTRLHILNMCRHMPEIVYSINKSPVAPLAAALRFCLLLDKTLWSSCLEKNMPPPVAASLRVFVFLKKQLF